MSVSALRITAVHLNLSWLLFVFCFFGVVVVVVVPVPYVRYFLYVFCDCMLYVCCVVFCTCCLLSPGATHFCSVFVQFLFSFVKYFDHSVVFLCWKWWRRRWWWVEHFVARIFDVQLQKYTTRFAPCACPRQW